MNGSGDAGHEERRATAAEVERELRAAADEVRRELRTAEGQARQALREALDEARMALRNARRATSSAPSGHHTAESARPSRADRKDLTRELLLDAAAEVFAEKGFHGASLDDVARAAGFTKGAVYSNFETKTDLFLALLERQAALGQAIAAVPLADLPGLAGEWMRRQAFAERGWDVLTVEFWLAGVRDPAIRRRLTAGRDATMSRLGALVDAKLGASAAEPGFSGRELIILLDALGTGLLMNLYLDADSRDPELFARAVRKLLADEGGAAWPGGSARPDSQAAATSEG